MLKLSTKYQEMKGRSNGWLSLAASAPPCMRHACLGTERTEIRRPPQVLCTSGCSSKNTYSLPAWRGLIELARREGARVTYQKYVTCHRHWLTTVFNIISNILLVLLLLFFRISRFFVYHNMASKLPPPPTLNRRRVEKITPSIPCMERRTQE